MQPAPSPSLPTDVWVSSTWPKPRPGPGSAPTYIPDAWVSSTWPLTWPGLGSDHPSREGQPSPYLTSITNISPDAWVSSTWPQAWPGPGSNHPPGKRQRPNWPSQIPTSITSTSLDALVSSTWPTNWPGPGSKHQPREGHRPNQPSPNLFSITNISACLGVLNRADTTAWSRICALGKEVQKKSFFFCTSFSSPSIYTPQRGGAVQPHSNQHRPSSGGDLITAFQAVQGVPTPTHPTLTEKTPRGKNGKSAGVINRKRANSQNQSRRS